MNSKKIIKALKTYGYIGKLLGVCAGGIVGFVLGGIFATVPGALLGGFTSFLIERTLLKVV